MAEVLSITLRKPHIPISHSSHKPNPKYSLPVLELWNSNDKTINPATICLDSDDSQSYGLPKTQLLVKVRMSLDESDESYKDWQLIGIPEFQTDEKPNLESESTLPFHLKSDSCELVNKVFEFNINIEPYSKTVPWGFCGNIFWHLTKNPEQPVSIQTPTKLEIYAIVEDIAQAYKSVGIPRELLKLFVLPTIGKRIKEIEEWTNWVVRRCHASTLDLVPPASIERIHSYSYNVEGGGSANFMSHVNFDLDGWLENRSKESTNPRKAQRVNCYDQAGLVNCCLFLGYPYKYKGGQDMMDLPGWLKEDDKKKMKPGVDKLTIGVWYKGNDFDWLPRFGYIKKTDLVGRGNTNDPFFDLDPSKPESKQSNFRNHKCASIRSEGRIRAADACAGPFLPFTTDVFPPKEFIDVPPEEFPGVPPVIFTGGTIEGYLYSVIDKEAIPKEDKDKRGVYKDYNQCDADLTLPVQTIKPISEDPRKHDFDKIIESRIEDLLKKESKPITLNVDDLFNAIRTKFPTECGWAEPVHCIETVADRSNLTLHLYGKFKEDVENGKSVTPPNTDGRYLTITFDIMKTREAALVQARTEAASFSSDFNNLVILEEEPECQAHHVSGEEHECLNADLHLKPIEGMATLYMMIYSNILIVLRGEGMSQEAADVSKEVRRFLNESRSIDLEANLPSDGDNKLESTLHQELWKYLDAEIPRWTTVGQQQEIQIKFPGVAKIAQMNIHSETGNLYIEQPVQDNDKWTIRFMARTSKNTVLVEGNWKEVENDRLIITFAEAQSYSAATLEYSVKISAA